jgi:Tfp pilus assembly protein PilF
VEPTNFAYLALLLVCSSACAGSNSTANTPLGGAPSLGEPTPARPGEADGEGQSGADGDSSGAGAEGSTSESRDANQGKKEKAPRPKMTGKAEAAFKNGEAAFKKGDLSGAKAQFRSATASDARAYAAFYSLGVTYEHLGMGGKAKESYQQALSVVPDHEASVLALSLLLAREGRNDDAIAFLQKKQSEGGKSAAILAAMAEVKSLQGESGRAQQFAQEALKLDPNYKPAMVALARDHYRARRIDLALYALRGILDGYGQSNPPRDKNNGEARLLRGLIYAERGLRGPAMEDMTAAVLARPDLVDAHLVLANYMMEGGNAKGAQPHLEMAVRYDNKNVAAHLQLGDAYRLLGRPDDARRELEWVLLASPNQPAAHYNLGLLFLLGGQLTGVSEEQAILKAIEHLEAYLTRAQRGGPDDVGDLITRAKTKLAVLKAQNAQRPQDPGGKT